MVWLKQTGFSLVLLMFVFAFFLKGFAYTGGQTTRKLFNEHLWEANLIDGFKDQKPFSSIYNFCPSDQIRCDFGFDDQLFFLGEEQKEQFIRIHGLTGVELHRIKDTLQNTIDVGFQFFGQKNQMHFWLDARLYSIFNSRGRFASPDGEIIETQEEGDGSNFTYGSFARSATNLYFDTPVGHIGFQRMPFKWGPGTFFNLTFSDHAATFPAFYYKGTIGAFSVESMWGQLNSGANQYSRYIYAKRYELEWKRLLFGVSELMVVYKNALPEAVVPTMVLFIEKGQGVEDNNNGLISFDLIYEHSYNQKIGQAVYGEFMIDDMQEPTSLFNDFWANKWGSVLGTRLLVLNPFQLPFDAGFISEYSRLEPYAYTHYHAGTAQISHQYKPLGYYYGPNAESFILHGFISRERKWRLSVSYEKSAKGKDGSSVNQPTDSLYQRYNMGVFDKKSFLDGAKSVHSLKFGTSYFFKNVSLSAEYDFRTNEEDEIYFRIHAQL